MADDNSVLARVRQLRGVRWDWAEGNPIGLSGPGMGVIAQELEQVFPELVTTGEDGFKQVDYHGLVAPLIEAVKELDERLRVIEERVARGRDTA